MVVRLAPLYAGLISCMLIFLSLHVIYWRRKLRVGLGNGDKKELEVAIRIHGNFVEYVPFCLVLLLLLEIQKIDQTVLHGLGMSLILSRVLHMWGLLKSRGVSVQRFLGTLITFLIIAVSAILLIIYSF